MFRRTADMSHRLILHVEALRSEHNIYMTKDGRLSVAGLRLKDVPAVARAIIAVLNAE